MNPLAASLGVLRCPVRRQAVRCIVTVASLFWTVPVTAQEPRNPAQFVDAALQVAQSAETNQAKQIWDGASLVMRRAIPRDRFVADIARHLSSNGRLQGREWYQVSRTKVAAGRPGLPPGEYLTVVLLGTNKAGAPVQESISFVLDADNVWRLSGYATQ